MASLEASAYEGAPPPRKILCLVVAFLAASGCAMSDRDTSADDDARSEDTRITVVGRLTNEGVECQALQGDDGRLYTLLGNIGTLPVESRVRVLGERLEFSSCQQGITIRIQSITPADS